MRFNPISRRITRTASTQRVHPHTRRGLRVSPFFCFLQALARSLLYYTKSRSDSLVSYFLELLLSSHLPIHRRLIYKEHTRTHAEGADPRVSRLARAGLRVDWSAAISRIRDHGRPIHRRCIYKGDTSTYAQGTDPRVALGA